MVGSSILLERAAKKRAQLEAQREEREARRQAGTSWHDDLFTGSLAHQGQTWCAIGFLISMVLMFVVVLPAQLLSGHRTAPPVFYYVMLLFLPSFFGLLLFRYLEYVQKGERFGRGQLLQEPLSLPASSYRTKELKEHMVNVLIIGPTIRDRMFGFVFLVLPAL